MENVLYVSDLRKNLILVLQIDKKGDNIRFRNSSVAMSIENKIALFGVAAGGGLYEINTVRWLEKCLFTYNT